jgi:alkaline phosphatase D
MLFLGDFIYVDVPLRLSSSMPHYRSEHRRVYASPSWLLPGLSNLPWLHTLDDHEIANDWSAGHSTPPFPAARDPFLNYHVSVNPPTPPSAPPAPNTTFFTFTRGPASFFMLDTRAYRTAPEPSPNATILGQAQLSFLLEYLSTPEPADVHWKIIASSVPFTKNWRFGTPDTWGGFLTERATVLAAMHAAESHLGVRVIVLSGDRHEFGAIRFPSNSSLSPTSGPHEFSVGPLSMFYLPFPTFRQIDEEDVAIKYLPDGNSKIGAIEIINLEGVGQQRSLMKYSLYVDGKVAWEYTLTSPGPEFRGYRGGILDSLWG